MRLREQAATAIRRRRRDLGMTQDEAAKLAGVSRRTWQRWESGLVGSLNLETIMVAGRALNVKVQLDILPEQ